MHTASSTTTARPSTLGVLDCGTCGRTSAWCNGHPAPAPATRSPLDTARSIVAGEFPLVRLTDAELVALIALAPGDHLALRTWLNCCRRGMATVKAVALLADLLADLDA